MFTVKLTDILMSIGAKVISLIFMQSQVKLSTVLNYRVGGVILRKEKIFVHHENRILIRYTLVDAHSATTLRFRPFLAFRSVREYTHENSQASRDYQLVENGIKTCMYPGYPELFMQLNKKNEFHYEPN